MHRIYTALLTALLLASSTFGQVAYQLSPVAHQQFFDANGKPLAGGFVYTYSAGSSTPLATYKDNAGAANTNPIVLDAGGFATIYLGQNSYKFIVQNSSAVQQWSQDNVQNISQVLLTTANVWTAAQTFNGLISFLGGTSDTTAADGNFFYRTDLHRGRWYDSGAAAWHSIVGADSTDTLTNKTLTSPTITTPSITGGLAVAQGGTGQTVASTFDSMAVSYAGLMSCGTTTTCNNTGLGNSGRSVFGSCTFAAATTCTVTGITAFTSASSFFCQVTEASNTGVTFRVQNPLATSFTITASSSNSDTVNYHCDGN